MSLMQAEGGFRSLTRDDEIAVDSLPVEGSVPSWLTGSLLRTGPARWEIGESKLDHWFDGQAMLHRFGIDGGGVSYSNRFLDTKALKAAESSGAIAYSEFATDPCRSLYKRVQSAFSPSLSDNCNVNLTQLGDRFIAMTETPIPVQFDARTLESAGVAYEPPGVLTTAHPHADRATGGMLNFAASLGPRNEYRFFHLGPEATEPEVIARMKVKEPAYTHSFGLTERWLVMAEFPFVVNPLRLAFSGKPYIENYRWKPELGTKITLLDRQTGEVGQTYETEARFGFHHVNAYEENGDVVADICTFPDSAIVEDLYMDRLRAGKPLARPRLERFHLGGDGTVDVEHLCDASLDLPRINYGRVSARKHRYIWGAWASPESNWIDQIVKVDADEGTTSFWGEPGSYAGEPVFVAEPGTEAEDAGVLLSVVFDSANGESYLLVLDAADLSELARARVPQHIPFGFHGQFARDLL
ncbi:MAG TPA: carotenoid oxygenase family protein [Solirubrobacterales bacterium]|nr:carotenoid oxygenase family protein [Solirubrobacterales bacterium]